ncbi:MAG: hypothetical protein OXS35_09055 [Dehalococcoidia bacterium]|nr:hypothetical protein [Dehalococcoidia bacterium]
MDVLITDAGALRRVTPALLSTYLSIHGWERLETWKERIGVWSLEGETGAVEVLIPLREQSDTYAVRISEVVATLAQVEERSQLDLYYDLMGAGADVIRLRPLSGRFQQNWSLNDSAELLARAKDLLQAAARAAENPGRPVHHGRLSASVQDYLREIRPLPGYEWGQELTVHSPVPVLYDTQTDMGDLFKQPFPRQVTYALNRGLEEAAKTAESIIGGESIETFETVARQGVSANLCEAVAALAHRNNGVEVSVAWAPVRPSGVLGGRFSFAESTAEVLGQGAELLRQKHPFLDVLIQGEIVRLDRQSQEDFDGHAVVLAEVDGMTVPLQVQFETSDRDEVLRAFRDNHQIQVSGNIYPEGRRRQLRDPYGFVVMG